MNDRCIDIQDIPSVLLCNILFLVPEWSRANFFYPENFGTKFSSKNCAFL